MNYLRQLMIVTLWEYKRFFKPKNEAIGILVMFIVSGMFYLGGRFVFKENNERSPLIVTTGIEEELVHSLSEDFVVEVINNSEEPEYLQKINSDKNGVLLTKTDAGYTIHAYKKPPVFNKIHNTLSTYEKQKNLTSYGISPEQWMNLQSPVMLNEVYIFSRDSRSRVVLAYFFAGLMVMAILLSFAYQFTAITGEKQLRITEQIISAIKPQAWMDGKIFGITLTSLSSMAIYSILSIIGGILYFQFTNMPVSFILKFIHLPSIALFFLFSLIGILLWNAVLAAIASMITDPNNSQKSSLMFLPVLFVAASFIVIRNPDNATAHFLAWFPLTSATALPVRLAVSEVAWYELAGSIMILLLTFYFVRIFAAKVFRTAILISGLEPTWGQLFARFKEA